jgi:hypothetical protein
LASLSETQLRALHAELEGLDRANEGIPEDTTPRMMDLLVMSWKQEAALTDDPEGYLSAARAHHEAVRRHLPKFHGQTVKELLLHALPGGPEWVEAERMATADGFPDPSATVVPMVESEVAAVLKDRSGRPMLRE